MACRSRLKGLLPFAIVNRDFVDNLKLENRHLFQRAQEMEQRWVQLNALMTHRAQQERGLLKIKQRGKPLIILAVKTSAAGFWEVTVE
jgi:hypothetical protein